MADFAGSLLGYLTGQLLNAWVMVAMKKATSGRFMWARMIASTLVGELADTIIFCAIASPILGITTLDQFISYTLVGYVYKCLVEIVLMPISYPVIGWFKRPRSRVRRAKNVMQGRRNIWRGSGGLRILHPGCF